MIFAARGQASATPLSMPSVISRTSSAATSICSAPPTGTRLLSTPWRMGIRLGKSFDNYHRGSDDGAMRVTIVGGSGGVGASAAFNLLRASEGHDVVLVDRRPEMITSHAMDLEQTLGQGATGTIRGGDATDIAAADVLVVAAAVPLTVNTSR